MKKTSTPITLALLTLALALGSAYAAPTPVAGGTTTTDVNVVESTQVAMGWSVKKTLMGKTIYNESGQKVGKVEDLIISPDKNVSFIIVGAGGFVGIGRHDVAVPISKIQDQGGKLVMAGATPAMMKALPVFQYSNDTSQRDKFVDGAEKDIAAGKARLEDLQKRADTAASDSKGKLDQQIAALRIDIQSADAKLAEMKQAAATRWKEFQAGVSAATARLRKSLDTMTG